MDELYYPEESLMHVIECQIEGTILGKSYDMLATSSAVYPHVLMVGNTMEMYKGTHAIDYTH